MAKGLTHPGSLAVRDVDGRGGLHHRGDGGAGVGHAEAEGEAACGDGDGGKHLHHEVSEDWGQTGAWSHGQLTTQGGL